MPSANRPATQKANMVVAYRIAAWNHPYSAGGGGTTLLLDGPTADGRCRHANRQSGGRRQRRGQPLEWVRVVRWRDVLIGTVSFWPILRKSDVNPLTDLMSATLVRYLSAMWPSVSPRFTVYVRWAHRACWQRNHRLARVAAGMIIFLPNPQSRWNDVWVGLGHRVHAHTVLAADGIKRVALSHHVFQVVPVTGGGGMVASIVGGNGGR